MIHELVTAPVNAKKVSVSQWCRVLGISRSGLYAARHRRQRPGKTCPLATRASAAFEASGRSYGSRRLSAALRAQGLSVGRHKARTLMRVGGLRARWRRKFIHTTDSRHALPVAANVLDRQFKPTAPDRAWVSDITYVRTRSGWLYLAVVLDLFSRKIVGWAMAPSMPAELVCTALSLAIASRKPTPGLIVHSDRGSQYASHAHTALLARHGLVCSMSRKGNCWDNAVMERFFLNLKMERVRQRDYANHPEAQADIADYIVNFYNAVRLHSTLGYQSPCQYEQQHAAARRISNPPYQSVRKDLTTTVAAMTGPFSNESKERSASRHPLLGDPLARTPSLPPTGGRGVGMATSLTGRGWGWVGFPAAVAVRRFLGPPY